MRLRNASDQLVSAFKLVLHVTYVKWLSTNKQEIDNATYIGFT